MKRYVFAVRAYLLPTFALGFVWHLVLFQSYYEALAIYRRDVIIPFGFLSMLIQAATFALVYEKAFARSRQSALQIAALRRCGCSVLVELHDAGRRGDERDTVPDYVMIETAFTIVQWALVAPFTVLSFQARDVRGRALPVPSQGIGATDRDPIAVP